MIKLLLSVIENTSTLSVGQIAVRLAVSIIRFPTAGRRRAGDTTPGFRGRYGRLNCRQTFASIRSIVESVATILVVDNDPVSRDAVCDVLEKRGHNAHGASGAQDALQQMRLLHSAVDLMVIDPEIPALTDGVYLLRRIRQRFANIPAIVISASLTSLEEGSGITRALDVADLLEKPLDPTVLSNAVTSALAVSE